MRNRSVTYIFVTDQLPFIMRRDVFQAIADPVRREIIGLISENTLTINEIADHFEISRPAISKHIKILEECGIVSVQQKGRERYCQMQPSRLVPAFMWIDQYRYLWEEKIDAFENYLDQLKNKSKQNE